MATTLLYGKYRDRIIEFLGSSREPATLNEIRLGMKPGANHGAIRPVLEEMERNGDVVRGEVVKCRKLWTTWALPVPTNRIKGLVAGNGYANGHANGHAPEPLDPIPPAAGPITFRDAQRIVEDLFLGIESLRFLMGQLDLAVKQWPNLPLRELIELHCEATGKEVGPTIVREVLPILIRSGSEATS